MHIKIVSKSSKDWIKSANLVREKYQKTFGADIIPNPEYFWVCLQPSERNYHDTQIVACMGMTLNSQSFFSEQYLDEPIEKILSRLEGKSINRDQIVEVGSLASLNSSIGTELMRALATLIWSLDKRYLLCTATKPLTRIFKSIGLVFEPIQIADYRKLGENTKEIWGKYYEKQPKTGFIELGRISRANPECKYDMGRDSWSCKIWDEIDGFCTPFWDYGKKSPRKTALTQLSQK